MTVHLRICACSALACCAFTTTSPPHTHTHTNRYLYAVIKSLPVVRPSWVLACAKAKQQV